MHSPIDLFQIFNKTVVPLVCFGTNIRPSERLDKDLLVGRNMMVRKLTGISANELELITRVSMILPWITLSW